MAMTGGPRHRVPRRLAAVVTVALLVGLVIVGFVVLRPTPSTSATPGDPAATSSASPSAGPTRDLPASPVLKVVDGDTVHVLVDGVDETVRIIGINTPETDECWGSEATQAAVRMLDGATVTLIADPTQSDRDRYGRLLRYVVLPDGSDFGLRMISDGNADEYTYDDPYANQQSYRDADAAAAAAGEGLWNVATCGGNPKPSGLPTVGSDRESSAPTTAQTGPNGCDIKGNISANGKIYHLPGSADYDRTRIDESKDERWFCSVAEAEAAGWRARN